MKLSKLTVLTFVAFLGTFFPTQAQVVVFNSFGAGNSYNQHSSWYVGGASASGGYSGHAEFFTPGISGNLYSIMLATIHDVGGSGLSNFFISQDNNGLPGAVVEEFTKVTNPTGVLTINSNNHPLLQAGTKYWFCDEPGASNSDNGWDYNNLGQANGFAAEFSQGSWFLNSLPPPLNISSVFKITVTPVPEPSVSNLGVCSVCFLFLFDQRRKPAVKD